MGHGGAGGAPSERGGRVLLCSAPAWGPVWPVSLGEGWQDSPAPLSCRGSGAAWHRAGRGAGATSARTELGVGGFSTPSAHHPVHTIQCTPCSAHHAVHAMQCAHQPEHTMQCMPCSVHHAVHAGGWRPLRMRCQSGASLSPPRGLGVTAREAMQNSLRGR